MKTIPWIGTWVTFGARTKKPLLVVDNERAERTGTVTLAWECFASGKRNVNEGDFHIASIFPLLAGDPRRPQEHVPTRRALPRRKPYA